MIIYKTQGDDFYISKTDIIVSQDNKKIYIEGYGPSNCHGPTNFYIKLSRQEWEDLKTKIDGADIIRQGTAEFGARFDDPNDDWAFT